MAGAFHTEHMAPAVGRLAKLAVSVSVHDPRIPVLSNRDGQVVDSGSEILDRLVGQIANPVRWDLCLGTMSDLGVTGILEMPPAGTLTGIAKRALKGVETFALKTPDQLDEARLLREARRGRRRRHRAPPPGRFSLMATIETPQGAKHAAILGSVPTVPPGSSPTPTSSRRSTPATSGSSSCPASSSASGPPPRRPSS